MGRSHYPKLQLHKASGQFRVRLDGKDHYLGKVKADAMRRYDELIVAWKTGLSPEIPASGLSLAQLADEYKRDCLERGRPWNGNRKRAMVWLSRTKYWRLPASRFNGPALVEAFRINRGSYQAHTLATTRKIIVNMFRRGVALGLVEPQTWWALRSITSADLNIPPISDEPKPANPKDVAKVIAAAPQDQADLLRIHRWTGMRPGEAIRLSWAEIDTRGKVWIYSPAQHKSAHRGAKRRIYLGPRAQAALMKYRSVPKDQPIFQSPTRPWSPATYGKLVERLCEKAKVPKFTPNQLRHLRLSEVRKESGLDAAQVIGGHAHISTTEAYAERQVALAMEVAAASG